MAYNNKLSSSSSHLSSRSSSSSLSIGDFTPPPPPKRQSICVIFGASKTGKTSFVTKYAPSPFALLCFDMRSRKMVHEAREAGKEVLYLEISLSLRSMKTQLERKTRAQELLDKVLHNIYLVTTSNKIRTLCIDTGTEFNDLCRLAYDGDLYESVEFNKDKGFIKRQWTEIFRMVRQSQVHLVVTARASEIWLQVQGPNGKKQGKASGQFKPKIPSEVLDLCDWSGELRFKKDFRQQDTSEIELQVKSAGENREELLAIYDESDWGELGGPFVFTNWKMYPGSDIEEWE